MRTIDDGTVTVDRRVLPNGANSALTLNSGTLNTRSAFVTDGSVLVVGTVPPPQSGTCGAAGAEEDGWSG